MKDSMKLSLFSDMGDSKSTGFLPLLVLTVKNVGKDI
jgi:hypothetical protein